MRHANHTWRTMLDPEKWSDGSKKELEMPDDDPEAMVIVLRIAHLQFNKVPKAPAFKLLLQLAIVCDKYDLFPLLHPFIGAWKNTGRDSSLPLEDRLFVAYSLKMKSWFMQLATVLVEDLSVGIDPFDPKGEEVALRSSMKPAVPYGKDFLNPIVCKSESGLITA